MAGERAELIDDTQHHRLGLHALELDLALAEISLDAVEFAEKVVVPEGAAEFAVGHGLEADVLLALDDLFDLPVFDRFERGGVDLALLALGARLFERRAAQQAADMVGAEGGRDALGHGQGLVSRIARCQRAAKRSGAPLKTGPRSIGFMEGTPGLQRPAFACADDTGQA